jgi:hypothetical protein
VVVDMTKAAKVGGLETMGYLYRLILDVLMAA